MATAEGESVPKGNVADLINRLSRPDLAHKLPISTKPILPTKHTNQEILYVATFTYSAVQSDEIDLAIGETIEFIEDVEDGWARGRKKNGKEGLFPTNFVERKKVTPNAPSKPPPPTVPTAVPTSTSAPVQHAPPTVSAAAATVPPAATAAKRLSSADDPSPQAIKRTPSMNAGSGNGGGSTKAEEEQPVQEMAKVLFVYEAAQDDELSLPKVGALVHILKKDTGDPGWYFGELNGKKGVFPDNFVELVKVPVSASPVLTVRASEKPPAKPPGGSAPVLPLVPPSVPAKPPKNVLSNNSSSNSAAIPSAALKPAIKNSGNTASSGGGGISELKKQLMSQGLIPRAPGEPVSKPPMPPSQAGGEPPGPTINEEEAPEPTQLVHITKNRPRQTGARRPMSMFAGKARGSQEDLLESDSAMTKSTMVTNTNTTTTSAMKVPKATSPSREPKAELAYTPDTSDHLYSHSSKSPSTSTSYYQSSPHSHLSHSHQNLHQATTAATSVAAPTMPSFRGMTQSQAGGDSQWVSRSEYNALLTRVAQLEARLAVLERK